MCWFFVARRSEELHIPGDSKIRTFSMALITAYDITEIADSEVDNAGLGVFLLRNTVGVTQSMGTIGSTVRRLENFNCGESLQKIREIGDQNNISIGISNWVQWIGFGERRLPNSLWNAGI